MRPDHTQYIVVFSSESHRAISLDAGSLLSEHLTVENSPVLFGCRTGICGTCLIEIEEQSNGALAAPGGDEMELLEIIAPDNRRARLACQIELFADIKIRYIGAGG